MWVERAQAPKGILEERAGAELPLPQTGLMVACYHGFGSVVALLSRCPFLDVNQQDKEGDTALMLAAQAGETLLALPPTTSPPSHRVTIPYFLCNFLPPKALLCLVDGGPGLHHPLLGES